MIILFYMCGSRKFRPYGSGRGWGPIINVFFTESRHGPPSMGPIASRGSLSVFLRKPLVTWGGGGGPDSLSRSAHDL